MKAYNTVVMTLILAALVAIAIFLFKLIKTDVPEINPVETQSERQPSEPEVTPKEEMPNNQPQIISPPITKETGSVEGKLCYPSEMVPPLDVYIQNAVTKNFDQISTVQNEQEFMVEGLQPGMYIAYAYPKDTDQLGGGYTNAVPCGLTLACTDHDPIEFEVKSNATTSGVDICDWYGANIPQKPN